jgi:hypothetical protein
MRGFHYYYIFLAQLLSYTTVNLGVFKQGGKLLVQEANLSQSWNDLLYFGIQRKVFSPHEMTHPQVQSWRWPRGMKDTCEYFEETVVDCLQELAFQLGCWVGTNDCSP